MREQVAKRHAGAIVASPRGDVPRYQIIKAERAALDLLHHERRGRQDFCEGRKVEDRVVGCARRSRVKCQLPERVAPQDLTGGANLNRGSRKCPFSDCLLEYLPRGGKGQDPANAPRPIAERYSVPLGGLIRLS